MKNLLILSSLALVSAVACKQNSSEIAGKKKSGDEKSEFVPMIAKKVQSLKSKDGFISCSGVDKKLNLVRTRVEFKGGELSSLNVAAYGDKANPANVLNDLTPDLKKYELFSHELRGKILDLDVDLEGKKFDIEVVSEMTGKARKIFDLDIQTNKDGEGDYALNAYMSYKEISTNLDLSEVFMGCSVHYLE
ncbi:MAG: hypothetical protein EBR09_09735 [Proteobacteria bacterium]|nr:hypothetical protein [Pseudomonadota bacterium]